MPTTLNRAAMVKLWTEDLEWLLAQPRTLERDHIEMMLKEAIRNCQSDRCPLGSSAEYRCNICGGVVHFDGTPPVAGNWGGRS